MVCELALKKSLGRLPATQFASLAELIRRRVAETKESTNPGRSRYSSIPKEAK